METRKKINLRSLNTHLILFMDLNSTIIAFDSAKNKDLDSAIWQLLAENYSAVWNDSITNESMTYREYMEKYLLSDSPNNNNIRKPTPEDYKGFHTFLKMTNHPLALNIVNKFAKVKQMLSQGSVFPSFLNMINELEKDAVPYTIILRTFGDDALNVISEIEQKTKIEFGHFATFKEGCLTDSLYQTNLNSPAEILNAIKPGKHGAWKDDYHYWHNHKEKYVFGKPFPINMDDFKTLSIFFDDNCVDKQILAVNPVSSKECNQATVQLELIKNGRIVPVNTLNAILDGDYFKDKLSYAMKKHLVGLFYQLKSPSFSIFQAPVDSLESATNDEILKQANSF